MPIRLVTFDLDDTFWDCESVILNAETVFFDWLSDQYPEIAGHFTPHTLIVHRREAFAQWPQMSHDFSFLRREWLRLLGEQWGYGDALVEPGFETFWRARNDVVLYPGVIDMLGTLKDAYQLATITNGNADVHRIGIGHWFDAVVTAADAGSAKPNREIFDYTLSQLEVRSDEAVHVGDDPVNDVLGAKRHGMRTVWINPDRSPWPHDDEGPDADIAHVGELTAVLDTWR